MTDVTEQDFLESEISDPSPVPEAPAAPEVPEEPDPRVSGLLNDLKEERRNRQALQSQVAQLHGQVQAFSTLRQELEAFRRSGRQEEDPKDLEKQRFEEDPVGVLHEKLSRLEAEREENRRREEQLTQYNNTRNQFASQVSQLVDVFRQKEPTYDDAYRFLVERRAQDYRLLGVPQAAWQRNIEQESEQIAISAVQQGRNPAEVVWEMAKAWGWKPQGGKAPATPEEALVASRTLGGGGKPAEGGSVLSRLDKMSDAEFEEFWEKFSREAT